MYRVQFPGRRFWVCAFNLWAALALAGCRSSTAQGPTPDLARDAKADQAGRDGAERARENVRSIEAIRNTGKVWIPPKP